MPRYIDADALIKKVFHYDVVDPKCYTINANRIYEAIKGAPTADVVEVVRCCDCKYCEIVINSVIDEPQWFCTRMVRAFDVDPTSFCSYGERKEN
jgi:hypothetical protein